MKLRLQKARIATGGPDEEGYLFFGDERLVAVLVRLSHQHEEQAGKWFLEHGFGPLDNGEHPIFDDLDAAQSWILRRSRL
jgi:hypothetical protein